MMRSLLTRLVKFEWFKHDNLKQTEHMRVLGICLCFKTAIGAELDKPGLDFNIWDRTFSIQLVRPERKSI